MCFVCARSTVTGFYCRFIVSRYTRRSLEIDCQTGQLRRLFYIDVNFNTVVCKEHFDHVQKPKPWLFRCWNKGNRFKTFEYATGMRFTKFENLTFPLLLHCRIIPVTLFIRPSRTGRIMSCPPSVRLFVCMSVCPDVRLLRPSVKFSYPLHNSDTVHDIFMKFCKNINHHQTMCREHEPILCLYFLRNYGPLNFFWWKSCPLHNFDTVQNIFMKLCGNINHHPTMCRELVPKLCLYFLRNYGPLNFFWWKSCPLHNFDTVQNIFMKLCGNINHHQTMCREQEPYLHLHFTDLCPFEIFPIKIVSAL